MHKTIRDLLTLALEEDGAYNDITTLSTVTQDQQARAQILACEDGVVAGLSVAIETFRLFDSRITVDAVVSDGAPVRAGDVLARITGPARSVLSAERVALNFLGHLSGIATLTAHCVCALEGTQARIRDTRKTTPGLRRLEKEAVRCGGGQNHRFNLSDGVLIKDNHIVTAGGIAQVVTGAKSQAPHSLKVEVECETLDEVQEALSAGADVILLDNMDIETMRRAVTVIHAQASQILIEASGNIDPNAEQLVAIAGTGVDFISLGALTHSAPRFDATLELV